jgi:hypothetical protein
LDRLFPPLSTESRAERVKIEALLERHWALAIGSNAAFDDSDTKSKLVGQLNGHLALDDEAVRDRLRADIVTHCPWLVTPNRKEMLDHVLLIADEGMKRSFSYHAACADAYFRCLSLPSESVS